MKLTSLIQEAVDERPQDVGLTVHRRGKPQLPLVRKMVPLMGEAKPV
jgi:hypothetical protein